MKTSQISHTKAFFPCLTPGNSPFSQGFPLKFPLTGLYLYCHVSPPFFRQTSTISCPCTKLTPLHVGKHSMIQFPPHLPEPTASVTTPLLKSPMPNRTHFSSAQEPLCPPSPREPLLNLPRGSLCSLQRHPKSQNSSPATWVDLLLKALPHTWDQALCGQRELQPVPVSPRRTHHCRYALHRHGHQVYDLEHHPRPGFGIKELIKLHIAPKSSLNLPNQSLPSPGTSFTLFYVMLI